MNAAANYLARFNLTVPASRDPRELVANARPATLRLAIAQRYGCARERQTFAIDVCAPSLLSATSIRQRRGIGVTPQGVQH
jgi:hypothetical protein